MEYRCDVEGFEEAFVILDDVWSRGDVRQFWDTSGEEHLDLILSKVRGCKLPLVDGSKITDPADLTSDILDEIDIRLWNWFTKQPAQHVMELQGLGEVLRRQLSDGIEAEPMSE